ncbi:MAG TPA: TldD/PmbA family protein [bacterium (Candidatus Stahlbacteria)]|nr:TldD/PmbA family protein [Candidatus Stahlbacteria bacterium]
MADKIISSIRRAGYKEYEIFQERYASTSFTFRANRFYETKKRLRQGYGVRVIKDKRLGFMSGTDPRLVAQGVTDLKPTLKTRIKFPGEEEYQDPVIVNTKVLNWSEEDLRSFGKQVISGILAVNPDLKVDVEIVRRNDLLSLSNSEGLNCRFERVVSYFLVEAQLVKDGHILYIYDFENLSFGNEPDYKRIKDYFEMISKNIKEEVTLKPGSYPVLILPLPLSSLLSGIGLGVSGKSLEKGYSPLIDKVGDRVLSDQITIYDDGLLAYAFNSGPFDGEGVAKAKRVLFENGIFKGFVFDLETGVRNDRESTGNALRTYSSPPYPSINNLVFKTGNGDLERTLGGLDEAILVAGVVGGGHGNIYAGDFSVKLDLGFLIRKGEIVGRLTDTMMAGNCYQMLNNVMAIGNQTKDLGNERLPWILASGLSFATPQLNPPPR